MRNCLLMLSFFLILSIDLFALDTTTVRPLPFLAGDAVKITVFPDTTSFPSGLYTIDGEGYADIPVLGYLKITSMTSTQLEDTLKRAFAEILRYPNVRARPLLKITLLGGFQRPGLYWIDPHATLWQTIQLGGSTIRSDGIKKIKWEREQSHVSTNLVPYFESRNSLYQIGLKSGDRLIVTPRAERTGWEVFRTDVLPMVTISLSTFLTAATVYQTYYLLRYGND